MIFSHREFIEKKLAWYKTIRRCYCPALKTEVIFNSKGFRHLLYDGQGRPRSTSERNHRLSLLPLVVPVLKKAKNISEYRGPKYYELLDKFAEYWMFQEAVGEKDIKVTVILRRIGNGSIIFYSVWQRRDKKN